jgi:hypothetical protein
MKTSHFMCFLPWGFVLSPFMSCKLQLVAAQEDNNEEDHDVEEPNVLGEDDQEDGAFHHDAYDPLNENELNPCRRHPTWWRGGDGTVVDYETCQELTGWSPRDSWWRLDTEPMKEWLSEGKEEKIAECLDAAFLSVPETFWWAA